MTDEELQQLIANAGLAPGLNQLSQVPLQQALSRWNTQQPGIINTARGDTVAASPLANAAATARQILGGQDVNRIQGEMANRLRQRQQAVQEIGSQNLMKPEDMPDLYKAMMGDPEEQAKYGRLLTRNQNTSTMAAMAGVPEMGKNLLNPEQAMYTKMLLGGANIQGRQNVANTKSVVGPLAKLAMEQEFKLKHPEFSFRPVPTTGILGETTGYISPGGWKSLGGGGGGGGGAGASAGGTNIGAALAQLENFALPGEERARDQNTWVDQAALQAAIEGKMPHLGRGKLGNAMELLVHQRVARDYPDANLALNHASSSAAKVALGKLETMRAQIGSFEQTAQKNIAILEEQLRGIPDLGSPVLNKPMRWVAANVSGDPKMAGFLTALTTVQSEAAKILSSANASGGQITDSSRKEMQHIVNGDYSVAQARKALSVLKQDMGNRLKSIDEEVTRLKGKFAPPAKGPAAPAPAAPPGGGMSPERKRELEGKY